jgi:glycosyltransferase involved in cell wall biosynthesis
MVKLKYIINNSIKLLILIKHTTGGTGTYINQLFNIKKINTKNLKINILVLGKTSFRFFYSNSPYRRFYFYNKTYPEYYNFSLTTVKTFLSEFFWVNKLVDYIKPDLILSIDTHCNLITAILKRFRFKNIPLILTLHNNLKEVSNKKLSFLLQKILKKLGHIFFASSDLILSPSKGLSKHFKNFFDLKNKVVTVPSGIDIKEAHKYSQEKIEPHIKELLNKNFVIVSIGRFEIQKDFDNLIRSFFIIHKKHKNTKLLLIGDGYLKSVYIKLIKQLELNDAVFIIGWKKNVYPYLKISNLFVLSSHYEGFGYVILEAMSQKIPVIATDSQYGPKELIGSNNNYGILVPMKSKKAMAQAMDKLLTDEKKYNFYAQKSLERAKYFSLDKMLSSYKNIILNISRYKSSLQKD